MSYEYNNSYNLVDSKHHFYLFDITLENNIIKKNYKKLKSTNKGYLFDNSDKINFEFNKIKIVFFNFDNANNIIVLKKTLKENNNLNLILKKDNLNLNFFLYKNNLICKFIIT